MSDSYLQALDILCRFMAFAETQVLTPPQWLWAKTSALVRFDRQVTGRAPLPQGTKP